MMSLPVSAPETAPPDLSPQGLDGEITALLQDLSAVQHDLLQVLGEKRRCLLAVDAVGLDGISHREGEIIARLQAVQDRRTAILAGAGQAGLADHSLTALAQQLPAWRDAKRSTELRDTAQRMRLLQHQSLANWVVIQRTLVHLSQMLEIIATGGRLQPTYGSDSSSVSSGTLLNQEV
jgi:hypothetical protein